MKKNRWICYPLIAIVVSIGYAQNATESKSPVVNLKEYRIDRSIGEEAKGCIECHAKESPGIVADWSDSRHAHASITCLDCHAAGPPPSARSSRRATAPVATLPRPLSTPKASTPTRWRLSGKSTCG